VNTVTLLLQPPVENGHVPLTSCASPAFNMAPPERSASGSGPTARVCMLTSLPSVAAATPTPVVPDLQAREVGISPTSTFDRLRTGGCSTEFLALASVSPEHTSSLNDLLLSSEHQAQVQTGASGPTAPSPPPAANQLTGHAEADHAVALQVLPGPDDTHQQRHQKGKARSGIRATSSAEGSRHARRANFWKGKPKFVAAPPAHPLLLSGKPITCDVEMVEVLNQE
jgi:hypothetical protein